MWQIRKKCVVLRAIVKKKPFVLSVIPSTNIYRVPTMCQALGQALRYGVNKTEVSWNLGPSEMGGAMDIRV